MVCRRGRKVSESQVAGAGGTYVVVVRVDFVEGGVHHGLHGVERVQHFLACLQVLLRTVQVL